MGKDGNSGRGREKKGQQCSELSHTFSSTPDLHIIDDPSEAMITLRDLYYHEHVDARLMIFKVSFLVRKAAVVMVMMLTTVSWNMLSFRIKMMIKPSVHSITNFTLV